ncbi:hypothetical protein EVAR_39937_1 [Eumeta japonica]|uniref:Uncharacterized protein n=1 Tax=Eumeta variegata TaxID=151549 RepID=A0A4C1X0L6_EUMVA|nr:hypothetical protein EVAR_39937_1 [Eumeta japonica]
MNHDSSLDESDCSSEEAAHSQRNDDQSDTSEDLREGCPSTATTEDNISAVLLIIETYKGVIYQQIRTSSVVQICCSVVIPKKVGPSFIRFKKRATNLVWNIVTGDEIWIYCYDPKTKQQSTVRVYRDEPKPTSDVRAKCL